MTIKPPPSELLLASRLAILEDRYKSDFELLDRYVAFSSEIGRLSLATIGGFGFVFSFFLTNGALNLSLKFSPFIMIVIVSISCLIISHIFSLAHRFFATDGMAYHLKAEKYLVSMVDINKNSGNVERIKTERTFDEETRNTLFKQSGKFLAWASIFLAIGIAAAGAALGVLLFRLAF